MILIYETDLSSLRGGDLALRSSSLRGENRRGGLRARGGDLALARQLSLRGERSRLRGDRDLLLGGERSRLPGCQLSLVGVLPLLGGDLSLSPARNVSPLAAGLYDSPLPILVTSPSPL